MIRVPASWIAVVVFVLSACARPAPAPMPPPPTPVAGIYYEEELRPVEQVQVEITGFEETPTANGQLVIVAGTLVNRGAKATTALQVRINALDEHDEVVMSVYAATSSEQVAVNGEATFSATMLNRPEVRRYHVEAIAR